ncbi:MAG: adenylate/guanylate cyclase domain-containing protein [Ferruginibacter sp.]
MEENIAILMADLSGYTALTETHGAESAADLIDKYLDIVENCLVGDSKLHERTGDEVMIVSTSPDFLLASAYMIMKATSNEDNFLQVHGGLHYGKILKRRNGYFGAAINLTSRIAAKANPGTFWCSEEFINSLSDKPPFTLQTKGKHSFKNVSEHKEMYELSNENKSPFFIDSVCRMLILDTGKAIRHPTSEDIFFCSPACLDIFIKNQLTNPEVC